MRILITGSRHWTDYQTMSLALRGIYDRNRTAMLVHGNCAGADLMANQIWRQPGGQVDVFDADSEHLGRAAGPRRNQEMVDSCNPSDICLAFPLADSRGTRDCMRRAEAAGIPVTNYGDQVVTQS